MGIIQVTLPNPSNIAKGVAMSTLIGKTFPNGKPLPVIQEKTNLHLNNDYLGVPALTELRIKYNGDEYVLNDCVMTVNMEKQIIQTYLQGRSGSIKEYIADGDYSISVQAAIAGDYLLSTNQQYESSDAYPIAEMKLFMGVLKAPEALEVSSDWLDLFGVKSIVIMGYSFEQQTHSNRQTFTMQCLSDEPYEIKLLNDA
jgi:hypothetical protein